ncbi:regulator of chromosome condensation [Anaeramoeba flamelloides]|uniref:Regulator of chromosome condensation n=1 Tax=Anaeramoeba flamelloides TaxID=1746091 RepID=A0AAV7ZW96_9EUKA|nr:regulator of chromosome condensation [Anaeramoeba flamelloides]
MTQKIWATGENCNQFNNTKEEMLEKPTLLKKFSGKVHKMAASYTNLIVAFKDNQIESMGKNKYKGYLDQNSNTKNDPITKISSGFKHNLLLTKSGKVYAFGNTDSGQLGSTQSNRQTKKPQPFVHDFQNLKVIDILANEYQSLLLFDNGDLYAVGKNSTYLIDPNKKTIKKHTIPEHSALVTELTLISEDVIKISEGNASKHLLYLTNDYTLWGQGANGNGQLGIKQISHRIPQEIINQPFENKNIKTIFAGYELTLVLDNDGKLYTCGSARSNGFGVKHLNFTKLAFFDDKPVKKACCGSRHTIALTKNNKIYYFGYISHRGTALIRGRPVELVLPDFNYNESLSISTGVNNFYIYTIEESSIIQDFKQLYVSKDFTDYGINGIQIHKSFVEFRLNCGIEKIEQNLKNYSKEETNNFFMWVYYDHIENCENIEIMCKKFEITNIKKKLLKNDLEKLYKDDDSKDFNLLIKDEDEDEEEDHDNEEEGNFEEIPVHKFVLLARSGLFREMFKNISKNEQNINQIQDYSRKSIESLEKLIKYFYTDQFEITADDDPELIFEELSDAIDYYQLSDKNNFNLQLNNILEH